MRGAHCSPGLGPRGALKASWAREAHGCLLVFHVERWRCVRRMSTSEPQRMPVPVPHGALRAESEWAQRTNLVARMCMFHVERRGLVSWLCAEWSLHLACLHELPDHRSVRAPHRTPSELHDEPSRLRSKRSAVHVPRGTWRPANGRGSFSKDWLLHAVPRGTLTQQSGIQPSPRVRSSGLVSGGAVEMKQPRRRHTGLINQHAGPDAGRASQLSRAEGAPRLFHVERSARRTQAVAGRPEAPSLFHVEQGCSMSLSQA